MFFFQRPFGAALAFHVSGKLFQIRACKVVSDRQFGVALSNTGTVFEPV